MTPIKLYKIGEAGSATRLASTPMKSDNNIADFILEDGVMKVYSTGSDGFQFYPTELPYTIVASKSELQIKPL
jgi:hypothetical protein